MLLGWVVGGPALPSLIASPTRVQLPCSLKPRSANPATSGRRMQTIRIATTDIHSRRKLLKLPICCYPSPTRTPKREVSPRPKHPPCLPALSQRACPALHSPKLTVIQSLLLQSKPAHRDSRRRTDSCALCIVQPDPRPPSTHTSPYPLATRLCLESTLPSCQQPYYFRRKHTAARQAR
jgi:hypothetical protein